MFEFLSNWPEWVQQLMSWLTTGGVVTILTLIFTTFKNKSLKRKYELEAKDDQIEALIGAVLELKKVAMNLAELIIVFVGSMKTLPEDSQIKANAIVQSMRERFGAKLDQTVFDVIELAKAKSLKAKEEARKTADSLKESGKQATQVMENLLNDLVTKEINKNT